MKDLAEKIKESRPNLKTRSIDSYVFNITKLHEKINGNKDFKNLSFLKDKDTVEDAIGDLKPATQKAYMATIVVVLGIDKKKNEDLIKLYRDNMLEQISDYNDIIQKQEKSKTQEDNWTTMAILKDVIKKYKRELTEKGILKKTELNSKENALLQKWMVGSLYVSDDDNPPMRLDFTPMKIIDNKKYIDLPEKEKNDNNYLVNINKSKKFFSLGEYKTSGKYGIKIIPVGKKLNTVLNIYLKYNNDKEYLIYDTKGQPMKPNGLTKYLNKIFSPSGKSNISSNMIRHIFISEKFGGPQLDEKKMIADKMMHNTTTQEIYRKK